jgi:TM2 domain-containing membrane protein YozV
VIIKSRKIIFSALAFMFLLTPVGSSFGQVPEKESYFSLSKRLEFGNSLYREKDYLRALNEYREYLKTEDNDTVQFRFADCFFRIGRFKEAADNFKALSFSPAVSDEARLLYYESVFFQNDFKSFREILARENYLSQKYGIQIERLKFASYFLDDSPLPKENLILGAFPDSAGSQLSRFYFLKKFPGQKSATTAALLSTVVPGAGKIYTGEIGDGITSLAVTALSAYLAYSNFKADHRFRGWLFTGLAAFFYGGNIYGSAASARIYNARLRIDFDKNVKLFFEQRNYFLPEVGF